MANAGFYDSDEDVAWGPITVRELTRAQKKPKGTTHRHTWNLFVEQPSQSETSTSTVDRSLEFPSPAHEQESTYFSASSGEEDCNVSLGDSAAKGKQSSLKSKLGLHSPSEWNRYEDTISSDDEPSSLSDISHISTEFEDLDDADTEKEMALKYTMPQDKKTGQQSHRTKMANAAFYDSDEDVAWGPITVRELTRAPGKAKSTTHRHTWNLFVDQPSCETSTSTIDRSRSPPQNLIQHRSSDVSTCTGGFYTANESPSSSSFELASTSQSDAEAECSNLSLGGITEEPAPSPRSKLGAHSPSEWNRYEDSISSRLEVISISSSDDEPSPLDDSHISLSSDSPVGKSKSLNPNSQSLEDLDDTLAEMEMAFKYGLDYMMPQDKKEQQSHCAVSHQYEEIAEEYPQRDYCGEFAASDNKTARTNNKFDYIVSPVATYIKQKTPHKPAVFKKPKDVVPKSKLPVKLPASLKNIVSPIGVYINSPCVPLRQNPITSPSAVAQSLFKTENLPSIRVPKDRDNCGVDLFPQVIYKPSKPVVGLTNEHPVNLPASLRKYIPEIIVSNVEGRIIEMNSTAVCDQLNNADDLTTMSIEDSDMSVYCGKEAFIP